MKIITILFFTTSFLYSVSYQKIVENFREPTDIQFTNKEIFILQKNGELFQVNLKTKKKKLFLNLKQIVSKYSEQGLLGMALHPDFSKNGIFYLNYTIENSRGKFTVIAVYQQKNLKIKYHGDLLKVKQPYANHNAGQLAFDKKGYLYIGFGDGGSGGDPFNHGQNTKTYLGTMIRIQPSLKNLSKYIIPKDNPLIHSKKFLPEIWAYGLRNPWRYSFDMKTDELYLADVGQNKYEEINIIKKGGNYGWKVYEGFHCFRNHSLCKSKIKFEKPIYEYPHSLGKSITGGYVYRGSNIKSLNGAYIYGDFVSGRVWALWKNKKRNQLLWKTHFGISTFGQDKKGEIYFADFFRGKIYKIIP